MAKKTQTKTFKVTEIVGKKLADALKAPATPTDTKLGPNEKFPFGIKLTDAKGNISWERFNTAKDRDGRMASVPNGKRVDFQLDPADIAIAAITAAKPADKPAAALEGLRAAFAKPAKPAKPAAAAKPAGKPASAAAAAPKAEAKPKDTLSIHVNKTGRICFGKDAAKRLMASPFTECSLAVDPAKRIVRIEAVPNAPGMLVIREGGGRPYISATKQLKPLGFEAGTRAYDCEATPYGKSGFEFRLA